MAIENKPLPIEQAYEQTMGSLNAALKTEQNSDIKQEIENIKKLLEESVKSSEQQEVMTANQKLQAAKMALQDVVDRTHNPEAEAALKSLSGVTINSIEDVRQALQGVERAQQTASAAEGAELQKTLGGAIFGAAGVVAGSAHAFANLLAQNPKAVEGMKNLLGEEGAKVLNHTSEVFGRLYVDTQKELRKGLQSLGVQ